MASEITLGHTVPKSPYFVIEKRTQSTDKTVWIEQSDRGLKISILSRKGTAAYLVQKERIEGLPKINPVPKEFFSTCYAQVTSFTSKASPEYKVYFASPLCGGGGSS